MPSPIDQAVLSFNGVLYLAPVLLLMGGVLMLMVIDMLARRGDGKTSGIGLNASLWVSSVSAGLAAISCFWLWRTMAQGNAYAAAQLFVSKGPLVDMGGKDVAWWGAAVLIDRFGTFCCFALAVVLLLAICSLAPFLAKRRLHRPELFPLLLLSAMGMMLLTVSRDLLLSFAAIELLSLPLYVLCGLNQRDSLGRESSLKYFLLGAFASGFLIYGAALIYGSTASLNYTAISNTISHLVDQDGLLLAGLALVAVGFAFKLALVPFHAWVPDVYQGAPTPVTGFMAAGVKLAVAAALVRIVAECLPDMPQGYWQPALAAFAALSMLGGNLLALHQMSAKRLLACSAIAHSGYLAVGIAAGTIQSTSSILVYLFGYAIAALGCFALISYLAPAEKDDIFLDQMHELYQQAPLSCLGLTVLMLSLGGFPLTSGFIGKLLVFRDAWKAGLSGLVIFALLNSVVSFYYYLRFVMALYMQPKVPGSKPVVLDRMQGGYAAAGIVACVLTLLLGVFPSPLLESADASRIEPTRILHGDWLRRPEWRSIAGQPTAGNVETAMIPPPAAH
jgi:NADH-quinone oxidoreductase subunit N